MSANSGLTNILRALLKRKRWWLIPLLITLVMLVVLALLAAGSEIKPYIYPQF